MYQIKTWVDQVEGADARVSMNLGYWDPRKYRVAIVTIRIPREWNILGYRLCAAVEEFLFNGVRVIASCRLSFLTHEIGKEAGIKACSSAYR